MGSNHGRAAILALSVLAMLLASCGGGGGSSEPSSVTSPPTQQPSPGNGGEQGAADGPATYVIGGTMSGLVGSVMLQLNGSGDLTVTADGPFVFAQPLEAGAAYVVSILRNDGLYRCALAGDQGTVGEADVDDVSVDCSGWTRPMSTADNMSESHDMIMNFDLDMNNHGDALLVWRQIKASTGHIYKNQRSGALDAWLGQGDESSYLDQGYGVVLESKAAMSDVDDAVIAWTERSDFFGDRMYRATLDDVTVVDTTHIELSSGENISSWDLAMNDAGDAIIGWRDYWHSIFLPVNCRSNGSWSYTPASGVDSFGPPEHMAIAMNDDGDAIIAWRQAQGLDPYRLYMAERRNGTWSTPASFADAVSPDDGDDAWLPSVAMSDNGDAVVTWLQVDQPADPYHFVVMMSEYRDGAWHHPVSIADHISPTGGTTGRANVAMDDQGDTIIAWTQDDQVLLAEYRGGQWTFPQGAADGIDPSTCSIDLDIDPQVAMSTGGTALVAWNACSRVLVSQYRNGAWKHPTDGFEGFGFGGGNLRQLKVVLDDKGNAIVGWIDTRYNPDTGSNEDSLLISERRVQ